MIFDQSSKNYKALSAYMGSVSFDSFRNTGYYAVTINKEPEKEKFLKEQGLTVQKTTEIFNNWRSTGRVKFIKGKWYVSYSVAFNVQHELRHQNYSITEKTIL